MEPKESMMARILRKFRKKEEPPPPPPKEEEKKPDPSVGGAVSAIKKRQKELEGL